MIFLKIAICLQLQYAQNLQIAPYHEVWKLKLGLKLPWANTELLQIWFGDLRNFTFYFLRISWQKNPMLCGLHFLAQKIFKK